MRQTRKRRWLDRSQASLSCRIQAEKQTAVMMRHVSQRMSAKDRRVMLMNRAFIDLNRSFIRQAGGQTEPTNPRARKARRVRHLVRIDGGKGSRSVVFCEAASREKVANWRTV